MTIAEIEHCIKVFLVETLKLDNDVLYTDANLKSDIGLTSIDFLDIRMFVEKTFGWKMTREDILCLNTLSDLYISIRKHITE